MDSEPKTTDPPTNRSSQCSKQQKKAQQKYHSRQRLLCGAGIIETLFFRWISPIMSYGWRVPLAQKSIPELRSQHKPKIDYLKLDDAYSNMGNSSRKGVKLTKSLFKAFKRQILFVFLFALVYSAFQMYTPIITHDIINYISQGNRTFEISLAFFLGIFFIKFIMCVSQSFLFFYFAILGFNISNTLSLMIYKKSLAHPLITLKEFSVSDIINLSQVDSQRMTYMGYQLTSLIFTPFQIVAALILLYIYIGYVTFVGVGIMIIMMLFTLIFTKLAAMANDKLLTAKDARMRVAQEIIQIIKFIKVNTFQKFFFQKLNRKRQTQLKYIRKVNMLYVMVIFLYWLCTPIIVSLTFIVYANTGGEITAAKAFITIIIFNLLQNPIRLFPTAISQLIQIWSSVKRIQNYLDAVQINKQFIQYNEARDEENAIQIKNGDFLWGKQKDKQGKDKGNIKIESGTSSNEKENQMNEQENPQQQLKQSLLSTTSQNSQYAFQTKNNEKYTKVLTDINISIPAKKITMIIGDIGCGKSSLLYAILNQMTPDPHSQPKVKVNGSLAYSPQKPWIMSGTLKQNIIFNHFQDKKRLQQALYFSGLQDDLKILPNGLQTQIGQKGTNLSGGQKARVSLARALYSNKDIYLLDDILSAVDVHVGKFIIEQTILKYLKGKTVVMPTHAIGYLDRADNVILMEKGRIINAGQFNKIKNLDDFGTIMQVQKKNCQQKTEHKTLKQQEDIINDLKLISQVTKEIKSNTKQPISATEKAIEQLMIPQDHKKGNVSWQVYQQYAKLNGGAFFLIAIFGCMTLWTGMATYSNIQIQKWCNDDSKTQSYLHLYLVFAILASVFSGTQAFILVGSGIRLGRAIHKKMMKSLLYACINNFYNRVPVGRILNRVSKDLKQIDQEIGYSVGNTLVNTFSLLATLLMCVYASTPWIMILVVLMLAFAIKFQKYYLRSQRQCKRLQSITTSPIVSGFTSAINGVATIRAYGQQQKFMENQIQKIDINKRMRITREGMQSWYAQRLAYLSFFINMSALAFCLFTGKQNSALAGLLLTYSMSINDDLIGAVFSYASLETKMVAIERVSTFTKIQPEPGYKEYCKIWRTKEEGADLKAISEGNISFEGYSARYRENLDLVMRDINISIKHGDKVGIVGRTGAGKSTIINSLLRILQPAQGRIMIDGKSLVEHSLKDIRACMTMIQQQPTLINGTIRENLDPGHKYSDQEIENIVQQCNLGDIVREKGGIDAKITNENLSVGEKQLLCICRAFLKNSKIILIDEATANIDVRNDELIQKVIKTKFRESTVLTIAHRLKTLKDVDKILVLGKGEVIEWGSREQLMLKPGGIYRKMYESQDQSFLE